MRVARVVPRGQRPEPGAGECVRPAARSLAGCPVPAPRSRLGRGLAGRRRLQPGSAGSTADPQGLRKRRSLPGPGRAAAAARPCAGRRLCLPRPPPPPASARARPPSPGPACLPAAAHRAAPPRAAPALRRDEEGRAGQGSGGTAAAPRPSAAPASCGCPHPAVSPERGAQRCRRAAPPPARVAVRPFSSPQHFKCPRVGSGELGQLEEPQPSSEGLGRDPNQETGVSPCQTQRLPPPSAQGGQSGGEQPGLLGTATCPGADELGLAAAHVLSRSWPEHPQLDSQGAGLSLAVPVVLSP